MSTATQKQVKISDILIMTGFAMGSPEFLPIEHACEVVSNVLNVELETVRSIVHYDLKQKETTH
jgi:hypothetical protein